MDKSKYPPIELYRDYLSQACRKFNITLNEARNLYGLFTIEQWENLLQ